MIETLEFDLATALLHTILERFDRKLKWSPLSSASITSLDVTDGQGVYQLGYRNAAGGIELVYVGKTDAKAGLFTRLTRHAQKVSHRLNMHPSDVFFKAIRVYVFTPMDLEQQMIDHYKVGGRSPAWNTSGFGSNDPGKERDTSAVKATHFDALFPINTGLAVDLPFPMHQPIPVHTVLAFLKATVSYVIRFEKQTPRSKKPHPDLLSATVSFANPTDTVENILRALKAPLTDPALGCPWQLTVFPGYITVYKEAKAYKHGTIL